MDAQLLEHPAVRDTLAEGGDDLGVRDVRDLVAHLAEALDVLAEGFILLLHHGPQVIVGESTFVRPFEVGDELLAELLPRVHRVLREV